MELRRYLTILRQRALFILFAVAVAVGFTVATSQRVSTYTTSATLYVGASSFATEGAGAAPLSGDQQNGLGQVIRTFAVMIDSTPIAESAVSLTKVPLSADAVLARTSVTPEFGTNLLRISVTDADPALAQTLATGVAEAFVDQIAALEPGESLGEGDVPQAPVRIFERAKLPTVPQSSSPVARVISSAILALAFGVGVSLLIEYLDVSIRLPEDAESRLELPVIGVIPELAVTATAPWSASAGDVGRGFRRG